MSAAVPHREKKRWRWRAECAVHGLLERLVGWLPGAAVFHLGHGLGALAWHLLPRRRTVVRRNLRIAFSSELEPAAIERLARAVFRRTGANLLSAARTARLDSAKMHEFVEIENPEVAERAVASGRGVVVLIGHMGNWEVLARINRLLPPGTPVGAFYRPLNNPLLDRRIARRRQSDGTRLFSKRDSLHQAAAFLREGGGLGILADQRVGRQGELTRYFGRLTRSTPLPSLLVRRCQCEVLALSLRVTRPGRWTMRFHPVEEPYSPRAFSQALEEAMRVSPVDVFWFQDRWKVYANPRLSLRQWLGEETSAPGHGHRALLWLAGPAVDWSPPEDWLHPDLVYEIARETHASGEHGIDPAASPRALERRLREIDLAAPLPLDFILTRGAGADLRRAARRAGVPLVSLDD